MKSVKARFFVYVFTLVAFFAPFMVVLAVDHNKRSREALAERADVNAVKKQAEDARYQYYLEVSEHRSNLRQAMEDAKKQYEQLLTDQADMIKDHQTTVTKATVQPVVTQKTVTKPETTKKKSTAVKTTSEPPKSSSTTKTS